MIKCSRRVAHKTRKVGAFSARVLAHNSRKRSLNKEEIAKVRSGNYTEGNPSALIEHINAFVNEIKGETTASGQKEKIDLHGIHQNPVQSDSGHEASKHAFKAVLHFEDGCEMENIRAYAVIHQIKDITSEIKHTPEDLSMNECSEDIKKDGFLIYFRSDLEYDKIQEVLLQTIFLQDLSLTELDIEEFNTDKNRKNPHQSSSNEQPNAVKTSVTQTGKESQLSSGHQNILSVDVLKLDKLMDLVGEMVIAEAMVIQNPDLAGLELSNFQKASQRLDKITKEIQDTVMSIRMVSLTATFQKMNRIVRDMCKKLEKEANLVIIGQETEVDKNIIEHISDPLMHLVRNALDHGIEAAQERQATGKPKNGTVTLEAKSAGSDVFITVRDDGRGLNRDKILKKAQERGMLYKPESDMTDREVYNLILVPGFSTKDDVTEFSGRGVGMDVVAKNIEAIGGSVLVDSMPNSGTAITLNAKGYRTSAQDVGSINDWVRQLSL